MGPKLDRSALANALLRKSKGKQARPAEVVALQSSDSLVNAPPVAPSSIFEVQSKKGRRSSSTNGGDVAHPSTSGGGRPSDHSQRRTVERLPLEVSNL